MSKVLAALLLVASTSIASAQPGPGGDTVIIIQPSQPVGPPPSATPPPPGMMPPSAAPVVAATPAPQNEDWNNVSHVNGTPVPVGARNDYLYTFKKTIISSNPVGWMFGFYGVSVSHALSANMAIRGDINYMAPGGSTEGVELGIGLPIYFRRTYQGPFLEPGLIMRKFSNSTDCFDCTSSDGSATTAGPQMLVGWHWTYESGWNLAIAFGAGRNFSSSQNGSSYSNDEPFPNGYFRIGYAF